MAFLIAQTMQLKAASLSEEDVVRPSTRARIAVARSLQLFSFDTRDIEIVRKDFRARYDKWTNNSLRYCLHAAARVW
jgi:hypothetical protein